ncbi:MAG: hypothetical protein JSR66_03155 [Proteobacteria bacterium]|nr:hypothetical protein [Pseudomonadota bacterium]
MIEQPDNSQVQQVRDPHWDGADLKAFGNVVPLHGPLVEKLSNGKVAELKPFADGFIANLKNVTWFYQMPVYMSGYVCAAATCFAQTRLDWEKDIIGSPPDWQELFFKEQKQFWANMTVWANKYRTGAPGDHPTPWQIGHQMAQFAFWLSGNIDAPPGNIGAGYKSILSSIIIQVWMSFEAFASDLWTEALNLAPGTLASQYLKDKGGATLSLADFQARRLDPGERVGDAVARRFVKLQRFEGMRIAYTDVFGVDAAKIFDKYPDLLPMSKLRHLFAHRGGFVDEKFRDEMKNIPALNGYAVGDEVKLTFTQVRACWKVAVDAAAELFDLVDGKVATILGR